MNYNPFFLAVLTENSFVRVVHIQFAGKGKTKSCSNPTQASKGPQTYRKEALLRKDGAVLRQNRWVTRGS